MADEAATAERSAVSLAFQSRAACLPLQFSPAFQVAMWVGFLVVKPCKMIFLIENTIPPKEDINLLCIVDYSIHN